MYQVLIVAEDTVAEVITSTICEKYKKMWNIVRANSKEDIFRLEEEKSPDILFLSLSLKHINGLDLLRSIRKNNKKIHICVSSSLCSHDFISEVVLCGVDAFLPEPLKKAQLQQAVMKMLDKIEEEQVEWISKKGQENYLKQIRSVLECGFIYSVLFGEKNEKELSEYCDALGVVYCGCIFDVEIKNILEHTESEEALTEEIRKQLRTTVSRYERCVVGPKILKRFVIYLGWTKKNMNEFEAEWYRNEICSQIQKDIKKNLSIEVIVEAGKVYSVKEIYYSYQEAIHALCFKMDDKTTLVQKNDRYWGHREYVNTVNRLLDAVKLGRSDASQFFSEVMRSMDALKYEAKVNKIFQLIILCCHAAYIDGEEELQFLNYTEILKEMQNAEDIENWAYKKFEYILNVISENHGRRTSSTVKLAIDYIEQHYTTEISLDDVAKYVGISPQHFSKIFKMETGTNYVDWLSNLRIEQAKKYLSNGDRTIKEICYLVGYKDPNYFSRIFKKIVGMSPSEYEHAEK